MKTDRIFAPYVLMMDQHGEYVPCFHIPSMDTFGYEPGSGMLDLFCVNCGSFIFSVPLEDHPVGLMVLNDELVLRDD